MNTVSKMDAALTPMVLLRIIIGLIVLLAIFSPAIVAGDYFEPVSRDMIVSAFSEMNLMEFISAMRHSTMGALKVSRLAMGLASLSVYILPLAVFIGAAMCAMPQVRHYIVIFDLVAVLAAVALSIGVVVGMSGVQYYAENHIPITGGSLRLGDGLSFKAWEDKFTTHDGSILLPNGAPTKLIYAHWGAMLAHFSTAILLTLLMSRMFVAWWKNRSKG